LPFTISPKWEEMKNVFGLDFFAIPGCGVLQEIKNLNSVLISHLSKIDLLKVKRTFVSSFLEEQEKKQKNSLRNLTRTMDTNSHDPNHAALQKTRRAGRRDKRFVHRYPFAHR
jgi:hypothetical protein